ncbi:MAG: dTDP-4-dehydrorhamnose 3,5-epimerase [Anaerolineae bacterium]|nr:dTDP-4-dehydrorhamnose 3,5-epimerase [Anaerolineae bacterium]
MIFTETPLPGVVLVELERRADARGSFARAFCAREFAEHGLNPTVAQCNLSATARRGTLRGMHYSIPPAAEAKLVRCVRGAIYDVTLDLRPESPSFGTWYAVELSARNGLALFIPEGCAHGQQALVDDVEVFYQMSEFFVPDVQRGVRYDDPAFGIVWPLPVTEISDRDRTWPLFNVSAAGGPPGG